MNMCLFLKLYLIIGPSYEHTASCLNLGFEKPGPASIEDFKPKKESYEGSGCFSIHYNYLVILLFGIACKTTNIKWKLERGRKKPNQVS